MGFVFYPDIEDVEDAMVAALKADETVLAYAGNLGIKSFSGDLAELLRQVVRHAPAIYVLFLEGEFVDQGMQELGFEAEFNVICVARNLRVETARRKPSASGEVGLYQMMKDVVRILTREDLDLTGLEELNPLGMKVIEADGAAGGGVALGRVGFMGMLEVREDEDADGIVDLEDVYITAEVANPDEDNDGEIEWVEEVDPETDVTEVVQDLHEEDS